MLIALHYIATHTIARDANARARERRSQDWNLNERRRKYTSKYNNNNYSFFLSMAEKKELPTRKSNIRSACYCYYCCFCHWCGAAAAVAASASAVGGIVDGLQLCAWMIEQILNLISQYILYILEMFLTVFYFGLVVNVSVRIEI